MSLNRLNPEQYKAATTLQGPLLIIAGAGSGKTGVITARIAHMLENGITQSHILALTFTNKAADEMGERIKKITGKKLTNLTVSTFHAFGVKILRERCADIGFRPNFTIYDTADRREVIKEAAYELGIELAPEDLPAIERAFGQVKSRTGTWQGLPDFYPTLYKEYEEFLHLKNAFDFDDLLVKPLQLLEEHPEVLAHYQNRYRYIMVDEFQDTSMLQYSLVRLLGLGTRNLCVVGDDDQSIYSWRGANYQNIQSFESDFPERIEIKLERNYRSTGVILEAANAVIANNSDRKEKALWTEKQSDEDAVQVRFLEDDQAEAEFICTTINTLRMSEDRKFDDFGVLSRTNALLDGIEEALLRQSIPYKRSGGKSFFDRKEIKDMIAYLRLADNLEDDISLIRIINTPRRGIGKQTLATLREHSDSRQMGLYRTIKKLLNAPSVPFKASTVAGLQEFVQTMDRFHEQFKKGKNLAMQAKDLLEAIDYWEGLIREFSNNDKVAKWRYDNILKFISWFDRWENNPDNENPNLSTYLARIALAGRESDEVQPGGQVNLMTIHAAKGLEFNIAFIAGVEEGVIPSARSLEENADNIQEERRLFYVALTRAREKLFLTVCQRRRSMKETVICTPSSFLIEIPKTLIQTEAHEETEEDQAKAASSVFGRFKNL